jgi:hypothetical protein
MKYLPLFDRHYLLVFIITLIVFTGCKKSDGIEDPIPPTENPEPIRVLQSIRFYMDNGTLVSDTNSFEYDAQGRVISNTYEDYGTVEKYTYTGDKLTAINSYSATDILYKLNYAYYSASGDTIVIDFKQPDGTTGTDTVRLTYIFNNGIQSDQWVYLHFRNSCSCSPDSIFEKNRFYYNGEGNVIKRTYENIPLQPEADNVVITGWDDKVNPKRDQPKLNVIFLGLGIPVESHSLHNPSSYLQGQTLHQVEMTYNSEGYPLTFKLSDQDFISTQLVYNR